MDNFDTKIRSIVQAKAERDRLAAERQQKEKEELEAKMRAQKAVLERTAYHTAVDFENRLAAAGVKSVALSEIKNTDYNFQFVLTIQDDSVTFSVPVLQRVGPWVNINNNSDYQGGATRIAAEDSLTTRDYLEGWALQVITEQYR